MSMLFVILKEMLSTSDQRPICSNVCAGILHGRGESQGVEYFRHGVTLRPVVTSTKMLQTFLTGMCFSFNYEMTLMHGI